jgi:hypothetical protein
MAAFAEGTVDSGAGLAAEDFMAVADFTAGAVKKD